LVVEYSQQYPSRPALAAASGIVQVVVAQLGEAARDAGVEEDRYRILR
jgi:hypothetical protein